MSQMEVPRRTGWQSLPTDTYERRVVLTTDQDRYAPNTVHNHLAHCVPHIMLKLPAVAIVQHPIPSTQYHHQYGLSPWMGDGTGYSFGPGFPLSSQPAPPRHPIVAAMASRLRSDGLLSAATERSDEMKDPPKDAPKGPPKDAPHVSMVQSWRLRWCALFLLGAAALQALVVGGQLQVSIMGDNRPPHMHPSQTPCKPQSSCCSR